MAKDSKETSQQMSTGWVSSLISTAGDMVKGFNYKAQENEIELARLQAETAKATQPVSTGNNKLIYLGIAVVVVVVLIFAFKK
ncbi:MAG: hypothetical protein E6Q36_09330 [Chryseobacterium sp.]|jgi:hypothetical protein|nr:MAG: hypothetical protein E6Q36_09330 [Chryseobacterium sp.]